jgi:hypothetical protein
MFRAYLGPSSGSATACIQHLVLIILLDDCLLSWMDWNPVHPIDWNRTTDSHLKRIISTKCCIHMVAPPDDMPKTCRG